jgi:hypothetical protein
MYDSPPLPPFYVLLCMGARMEKTLILGSKYAPSFLEGVGGENGWSLGSRFLTIIGRAGPARVTGDHRAKRVIFRCHQLVASIRVDDQF